MQVVTLSPSEHFPRILGARLDSSFETSSVRVRSRAEPWVVFFETAGALDQELAPLSSERNELRNAACVVDACATHGFLTEARFNPIAESRDWEWAWPAAVAMMVLAYPEVHWIFLHGEQSMAKILFRPNSLAERYHLCSILQLDKLIDLLELRLSGFSPLYDATGLRETIRRNLTLSLGDKESGTDSIAVPRRENLCVAIDEEPDYANMYAYTAYRRGLRTLSVSTLGVMKEFLDTPGLGEETIRLTLEDVYLSFPDARTVRRENGGGISPGDLHLSDFRRRDTLFPCLMKAEHRTIVTVGHRRGHTGMQANLSYLRSNHRLSLVHKPVAGVYDIQKRVDFGGAAGPGYIWPPQRRIPGDSEQGGHSAPGRLLAIAETLIARTRKLAEGPCCVETAVTGATLALDAQQLLGNMTPTTALEALQLRHEMEVAAECSFSGVGYNFDVRSRIDDLSRDCAQIGHWFHPRTRRSSVMNATAAIVNALAMRFEAFNQFDEREDCLRHTRRLHRKLTSHTSPGLKIIAPIWKYLELLVNSVPWFIGSLAFWPLLFAVFFWIAGFAPPPAEPCIVPGPSLWSSTVFSLTNFFGLQPIIADHHIFEFSWLSGLTAAEVLIGYLHLGVFISHLYSLLSRR